MENNITESIQLMADMTTQFKTADGKVLAYYVLPEEPKHELDDELNQFNINLTFEQKQNVQKALDEIQSEPEQPRDLVSELNQIIKESKDA